MDFVILQPLNQAMKRAYNPPVGGTHKAMFKTHVSSVLCLSKQTILIVWKINPE